VPLGRTIAAAVISAWLAPAPGLSQTSAGQGLAAQWQKLLTKHVRPNGGVDYLGFEVDYAELEAFVGGHATLDLKGRSDGAKKAVLINLYNATMIYNLLRYARAERIEVKSPKFLDIEVNTIRVPSGNIWNGSYKVKLKGLDINLDNIEHDLLRGQGDQQWGELRVKALDPRVHTAVNCAAMSCPRVRETAYQEATVDKMLDENMREWLSTEAQFSKVDNDTLKANQIVYWYYDDFDSHGKTTKVGGAGGYLAQFINPTAKDPVWKAQHWRDHFNDRGKVSLKLSSAFEFSYDWRVNDVRNRP